MGKIDYFSIKLQKSDPIYHSGETLVGNVLIRVKERLKINSIKLAITGGARVYWKETSGTGRNRHTRHYSAYENYLNYQILFLVKPANQDLYLETGEYLYPFQIVLPPHLATSFEHSFGRVRYSIYSTIDIPWAFDRHSTRSFSVISHLDLNMNPNLRQPCGVSDTKVLCCGFCKSDPIVAEFSLAKIGYVPGEGILFNVTMQNRSRRSITEMTVKLMQNIRFHTTSKSRKCTRTVAIIRYPGKIAPHMSDTWNVILVIPPICSSSNGMCRIIDVSYTVVYSFDTSGIAIGKDLKIPIIVGTIPLRGVDNKQSSAAAEMSLINSTPSYETCMFEPNSDPNEMPTDYETKGEFVETDSNTFKPIYPYYKDYVAV